MYTGQQFVRAMHGVRTLRHAFGPSFLDVHIVSAGYGLIEENRSIVPYEVTFDGLSPGAIARRAAFLGIPAALAGAVASYELIIFLLGRNYMTAAGVTEPASPRQRHLYLSGPAGMDRLPRGASAVPMDVEMMARLRAGAIAVKGAAFAAFARGLARRGERGFDAMLEDATDAAFLAIMQEGVR